MGKKIKIAKRHIDLPKPYWVHAMTEINGQSERGAAIAGTAFLDLLLRTAIERLMRPEIHATIFENRGPLQDFSARIHVAFALKLIGSGAYLDLCILRDIRNAFAHSAESFGFERADIAALCNRLWYPRQVHVEKKPDPKRPREFFVRAVELIADGLMEGFHAPSGYLPIPNDFILWGPPWPPTPRSSPKKQRPQSRPGGQVPSQKTGK